MVLLADSTFRFLFEQWKDYFPPGYLLKEASIDKPFEEDSCHCHIVFVQENTLSIDPDIILKYRWFLGEKTLSNFTAIPDANGEVTDSCLIVACALIFFGQLILQSYALQWHLFLYYFLG